MCDFSDADIGIGKQRPRGFDFAERYSGDANMLQTV